MRSPVQERYGVSFPMFSKLSERAGTHPLFERLKAEAPESLALTISELHEVLGRP